MVGSGGSQQLFAAKLDSEGVLKWNTFLVEMGRMLAPQVWSIRAEMRLWWGRASVRGVTDSPWSGVEDAFVAKLDENGAWYGTPS